MNPPLRTPAPSSAVVPSSSDPSPMRREAAEWAVIGLFLLCGLVSLHLASALVVPMIAAILVGSLLARVGDRFQRIGVPPVVAGMALVAVTGIGLFLLIDALAAPVAALIERLPDMANRLGGAVATASAPFTGLKTRIFGSWAPGTAAATAGPVAGEGAAPFTAGLDIAAIGGFLGGLTPALGEILIFLATLVFFVAGRANLRRRAILAFGARDGRLAAIRVINAAEVALAHYVAVTATIYAGVGLATAAIAWAAGLSGPALWGVLTFVASFVPFLGAAMVTAALASAGLLAHDAMALALLPAGVFVVVHLVSENAVIPSILGRRFEINPFLVFVAIVFWTWMWGAFGAVLAVPMLLVARTVKDELTGVAAADLPG